MSLLLQVNQSKVLKNQSALAARNPWEWVSISSATILTIATILVNGIATSASHHSARPFPGKPSNHSTCVVTTSARRPTSS